MADILAHEGHKYKPMDIYGRKPHKAPKNIHHIFIRPDQLFYDVDAQLSILSKARRTPDGSENELLASGTSTYKPMFIRWMDKHIGKAKAVMSAFVVEEKRKNSVNGINEVEEIVITLAMPIWWDERVFTQLQQAIHDYVTNSMIAEFLAMVITEQDSVTMSKRSDADDALHNVKLYINSGKPGYIHKKLSPF